MSNMYNDMILENLYDAVIDANPTKEDLIDEILETTIWRNVDPDNIPETLMSFDDLVVSVVMKRFENIGE